MRVGILPHAGLSNIIPNFRLARSLVNLGCEVRFLGSDIVKDTAMEGHSKAWASSARKFGFEDYLVVHNSTEESFIAWLIRQIDVLQLGIVVLDAGWQSLAYALPGKIVIFHAGLPDFRSGDMPTWRFVHPNHGKDVWKNARNQLEALERAGQGERSVLYNAAIDSGMTLENKAFDFGCGEFANIPAIRAMSLPQILEFPGEAGRVRYLGVNLPSESDIDWTSGPDRLTKDERPLILCIFGTTGLSGLSEYLWLLSTSMELAKSLEKHLVAVVLPDLAQSYVQRIARVVKNLVVYSWVPLWETISARSAPTILVTTPGVGTFREAVASGTPVVAIPRILDQFGAAARIEYFGLGRCIVSPNLPDAKSVIENVSLCFSDNQIWERANKIKQAISSDNGHDSLKNLFEI